jgi:diacylglycerol kinase family enzyme
MDKPNENHIAGKKKDINVTIDGEPIGNLPATFQVYPHVLLVKM